MTTERTTSAARWARANRLKTKVKLGTITPDEQAELDAYAERVKTSPKGRPRRPVIDAAATERPSSSSTPLRATKPIDNATPDPSLADVPVVPPDPDAKSAAAAGAAPAPSGAAPAGSPLAAAQPAAIDPAAEKAAEEFAAGIGLLVAMGLQAAIEVWPDKLEKLPPRFKLVAASEEAQAGLVQFVEQSAKRVALKYGFRADVPFRDELVVGAAVAGSGLAIVRQLEQKGEHARVDRAKPADQADDDPAAPAAPAAPTPQERAENPGRPASPTTAFAHLVGG